MTSRSDGWSSTLSGDGAATDNAVGVAGPAPPPSAHALSLFGARLPVARRYADLLAGVAVTRGLIGPRETARLWDRHLVNCALVGLLLPTGARVVDVGSGAGLPGLALACLRPDLQVDLVDSMRRRTAFLAEVVSALAMGDRVRVVTGRAEDGEVIERVGTASWVTARAVAPLDRLTRWCLPLLVPGGRLLALKGQRAAQELAAHSAAVRRSGARSVEVITCGADLTDEPAVVVQVIRR